MIASPAGYVSASGKVLLDGLWRASAYRAEPCEPFLTNSRAHGFPIARTWTRQSGSGPSTIELTCVSESETTYVSSGSVRLAAYDILSDTMRLALGGPGAPRPASLDGASIYTTTP